MLRILRKLWRASHGTTAIEYGLIAGLLGLALVASLTQIGVNLNTGYNNIIPKLSGG